MNKTNQITFYIKVPKILSTNTRMAPRIMRKGKKMLPIMFKTSDAQKYTNIIIKQIKNNKKIKKFLDENNNTIIQNYKENKKKILSIDYHFYIINNYLRRDVTNLIKALEDSIFDGFNSYNYKELNDNQVKKGKYDSTKITKEDFSGEELIKICMKISVANKETQPDFAKIKKEINL